MKKRYALLLVGLVILIDQATKYLAFSHLTDEYPRKIFNFINLRLALNHGVAFSLWDARGAGTPWLLLVLTSGLSLMIFYLLLRSKDTLSQLAYAIILGGALANIIDRLRLGAVIDFIDVHIAQYHWPVFNFADSFICIGAFLMLFIVNKS